jgi:hypothetical protein
MILPNICQNYWILQSFANIVQGFAMICQSYWTLPSFSYVVPRIIKNYWVLPSFAKVIELYKVFTKVVKFCQCCVQILLSFAKVIEFHRINLEQSTLNEV